MEIGLLTLTRPKNIITIAHVNMMFGKINLSAEFQYLIWILMRMPLDAETAVFYCSVNLCLGWRITKIV